MDRKIEKPKWSKQRFLYIGLTILIALLLVFSFRIMNKKVYKIERDKILVKEVIKGEFKDIILIDAVVEPIQSILVNNPDGGTVEEIYIEDGIIVEKGTPLLKLSNPTANLSYMNQETAIIEQINNLRNLKLSLEKDQRDLTESLIDAEYALKEIERNFKIDTSLYAKGVIAKNDFVDSQEEYKYQQQKRDFLKENVKNTKRDNKIQIEQIRRSINLMERNLDVIHANMEKMLIRAPVSGQLSSFNPILGESVSSKETIAKIDVLAGYKIRGQVDEYYLSTVKPNQAARFSFDGVVIELNIKKVLPEVINGRFEIELTFVDSVPEAITTGLSLQVRLELSKAKEAILIPRGSYFQSSGGKFVYVLNENEEALKREIRVGKQNPSYYEVIEGLDAGEKIITSSYDMYKNFETIEINP